ncbi:hypothetical protein F0562_021518 [Nyssa sinensis]|uniref:Protein transport protein SEC23 n=1 Tax=Nyssa sinensis TaxID=561372 RepID=A0A5J5BMI4_9ASTE|nr:hypothetical protein F0562_021518 [Nyssa sinensis]
MSAPIVLVIDECSDEPHLQHLQSSLHAFVDSLPPTTRIGIVLYGRVVSAYDFSEESTASADVLPGNKSPTQESLKALIYGTGIYLSPVHASVPVAHSIFSSLRPYKLNIQEASRDRCLGTAVEVALTITQRPLAEMSRGVVKKSGGNSRIIVCAGGPNTYGPGSLPHSFSHPNYPHMEKTALKWMENLGREAHQHNTVVDIMCVGTCPVRISVLQPLAKASGGVLILHDDLGEAFGVNLQRASTRAADISRVITVRLPTVDSVSAYLESVQDEVAAVLIAKRTLLRAKNLSNALDMRATVDERVKDIASKFGSQMPKSKLYQFPKELSLLPELLFHLRWGPLLGSICLIHQEGGTFEELPAHDLAMQSDAAVVLDHGTDVFMWLGAELAAQEGRSAAALAPCRTLAEELTEMRFPAPRILAFKEGSSPARYFVSRLIPAHKDPPYEQEARFHQLRTLTVEQRTKLKSSFLHFDDPSFCEWMRSLKVLPPEPS